MRLEPSTEPIRHLNTGPAIGENTAEGPVTQPCPATRLFVQTRAARCLQRHWQLRRTLVATVIRLQAAWRGIRERRCRNRNAEGFSGFVDWVKAATRLGLYKVLVRDDGIADPSVISGESGVDAVCVRVPCVTADMTGECAALRRLKPSLFGDHPRAAQTDSNLATQSAWRDFVCDGYKPKYVRLL